VKSRGEIVSARLGIYIEMRFNEIIPAPPSIRQRVTKSSPRRIVDEE